MDSPRPLVALALAGALVACQPAAGTPDAGAATRLVIVAPTRTGDAVESVRILGELRGEADVRIFAELPARIRTLHVREGDGVRAGDPIVTLEGDRLAAGVEQATAALSAAEVARDQLTADLERARRLFASGAIPELQVTTLEAQLRSAEANLETLRAARRGASAESRRTLVRAPIDGTVALLAFAAGDMVAAAAPICSIVRTERMRLALRVTEVDYVRLREGMAATVTLPAMPNLSREGVVTLVSPVLDRLTRTATVEVTLDNADGGLRPGMTGRAEIELARRAGVVLAPARAVVMLPETDETRRAAVFVVEGGVASRREVLLGLRMDDAIEIREGLRENEVVVVEGQHLLRDGVEVRTAEDGARAARPRREARGGGGEIERAADEGGGEGTAP